MATKTISAVVKLRRDNDYNYEAKKSSFVPLKGEVCFVDTAAQGLRAKVGDGTTIWENLPYTDESIISSIVKRGYYHDDVFYSNQAHTTVLAASGNAIYIDIATSKVYIYNNSGYQSINETLPTASSSQPGIMRLYETTGQNTDGTMTQKAITDGLRKKVSAAIDQDDPELLVFSTN